MLVWCLKSFSTLLHNLLNTNESTEVKRDSVSAHISSVTRLMRSLTYPFTMILVFLLILNRNRIRTSKTDGLALSQFRAINFIYTIR